MATYCLIIKLNNNELIEIGKLGEIDFKKGYYIYVGSALNSLEGRIKRHLRDEKKLFWHVDYLLASSNSAVEEVIFEKSSTKWECEIAQEIAVSGLSINHFGCSDCKCDSHLFYFEKYEDAELYCLNSFKKFRLNAEYYKNLI